MKKVHTTNYSDTLIIPSEDCPASKGERPPHASEKKSVAALQFEMISLHPYQYTSDDVLFSVYAERNDIGTEQLEEARTAFFSKGQACFRASPLTKRYGWGIHANGEGKIAAYSCQSKEYQDLLNSGIKTIRAMRNKK